MRPIVPDEFAAYAHAIGAAFGERPSDEEIAEERPSFECDRSLAVFDAGRIVATAGAYSFDLTLPGLTTLPVAGVTAVGVQPTHRRRGLLRAMMQRQFDDVQARGEAVAILIASESVIYGRFGYGLATSTMTVEIDPRHAAFVHPPERSGHVGLIEEDRYRVVLPEIYDRARRRQPGALTRSKERWDGIMRQPMQGPDGAGPRFVAIYEPRPGQIDGAAVYRVKGRWEDGFSHNTLLLRELISTTPEATAALWRFCLDIDLITIVRAPGRPVDDPLRWLLADPRRLRVKALVDDLWVRILDVPAALSARRYALAGSLVLEVSDSFRPDTSGCYALEGGPEGATCRPTSKPADLSLTVADLGAAYLGGVSFNTLARAGRVRELTTDALRRADALFACEPAPWCATGF